MDDNRIERLQFTKYFMNTRNQHFNTMYDYVHIYEKWFYITKANTKFYLIPSETPSHQTFRSKRYILKIMFICDVTQPRWDSHKNRPFDGNIGIWTFIFKEPAKRISKNRPVGTMETECIASTNQVDMKNMFIHKVIPEIKQKWPIGSMRCITQQENAKPHTTPVDNSIVQYM